jgi:dethiobiotin synthetase
MYKGIFITATDTGAGKTYVGSALARSLVARGTAVGVLKPVSAGDRDDARNLIEAAGVKDGLDLVNPIHLKYPLSPLMSARLQGKRIDLGPAWKAYAQIRRKYPFTIVEGVGGLLVPLRENYSVLDMIKHFKLPVLIVARPYLGTINHTLLTIDKLRQNRITIAGVVINCIQSSTLAEKTNPELIRELTGLEVLEIPCKQEISIEQNLWMIGEKQI